MRKPLKINEKINQKSDGCRKNVIQTKNKSEDIDKTIHAFAKILFASHKAIYFETQI